MDWSDRIGRRIKLRDLHILQAVVEQGSIAKAARHLAISQPVVSKVIADLERMFGRRLLDRDRHGAEPTIYGASLLTRGLAVFDELRQSVKDIEYLDDPATGELRIATHEVMAAGLVSAIIRSLHRSHPKLTVHVRLSSPVDILYRELRDRNVDLIFGRLVTPFAEGDLQAQVLFNESTVIVAGRHNRLTRRRKLELADLVDEPWVFPVAGSVAERIAMEMFRSSGLEMPRRGVVCAPMPVIATLVGDGPYLANLPGSLVHFGGDHLSVKVLPIKVPIPSTPVGIVTLKRRTINPVAQLFIEHAREIAKPLMKKNERSTRDGSPTNRAAGGRGSRTTDAG
jgi:molybdate transport repressor ModE-like protein